MVGGQGWSWVARISALFYPEGSRYVEAVGSEEQVHGNSGIIAYASDSDSML